MIDKEEAIELRKLGYSLNEICIKLSRSKSTVYYWIKELLKPDGKQGWSPNTRRLASEALSKKYALLREKAYREVALVADKLLSDPSLRDFVVIFIAEGYKRTQNVVEFTNTDASTIKLFLTYIRRFSDKKIYYSLTFRENPQVLIAYWASVLKINSSDILLVKKIGERKKPYRSSVYGTMKIRVNDTYAKQRVDALCDFLKKEWDTRFLPIKNHIV